MDTTAARGVPFGFFSAVKVAFLTFFLLVFSFFALSFPVRSVLAQASTPTSSPAPGAATPTPDPLTGSPSTTTGPWVFDPEITEVGKNADRARQLLWWVWSHPGIHAAPVLLEIWGNTRNIVYVFVVLVLVAFGLGIILSRSKGPIGPVFSGIASPLLGVNVPSVLIRLGAILLYVTFSYIIVLGFIQLSEVSMQFIKSLIGKDLFNVFFAGSGNTEANYITFVGYRDSNLLNIEMVRTSVFMIRLTSLTYYLMSIVLILRTVILWFMLVLSPFLALLMPFVFIRNVGWIWIGVFFQWLFYGPLMVLFVVAIVKIWVAGIPYSFDFSRVNKPEGQVYKTAINILWGGPAQTLTSGNSSNYIDTYAEYVIALVMLWAAMILPWLLLRIFRDYCCNLLAQANASLSAIYDRLRSIQPPPPPATGPVSTTGLAASLPFRQRIPEPVKTVIQQQMATMREFSHVTTHEIARAMDVSVSRLSDVSRLETNNNYRESMVSQLTKIAAPERISSSIERERYTAIKNELLTRASQGDRMAQTMLMVADRDRETVRERMTTMMSERSSITKSSLATGMYAPAQAQKTTIESVREAMSDRSITERIATSTALSTEKVHEVLQKASASTVVNTETISTISKETGVSEEKVKTIIESAKQTISQNAAVAAAPTDITRVVSEQVGVPQETVKAVLSNASIMNVSDQTKITEISQKTGVETHQVQEILSAASTSVETVSRKEQFVKTVSRETGVSEQSVKDVLSEVSVSGTVSKQEAEEISKKTGTSARKVEEIAKTAQKNMTTETAMVTEVSKKLGVSQQKVKEVLDNTGDGGKTPAAKLVEVAKKTGLSEHKVKQIVDAAQPAAAAISFEDYEDVKKMWTSHYREAPVPVSGNIKEREDWLKQEQTKLTNISNLLASSDPVLKQRGLEQVAEILPFMFLGGFSDAETLVYIKAKLEAAKQVEEEMTMKEKLKKEVEAKLKDEDESTMVEVGEKKEKKEQAAVGHLAQEMAFPEEKKEGEGSSEKSPDSTDKPHNE